MIEVKNLVKRYGDHLAVDGLSFTVEKGQILGFLGPNGAGKSTTMNMITGYISCTEGTATINGHDIFQEPEETKKYIGYLPEQPPLYFDMTVMEYLRFVAELKKVKKSEREKMIYDIMESTKLTDVGKRLIRHLSKGYKQRVGIAGALMGYPEVIILDEPTVGLDPKQIIEIRDLIKKLSQSHTVILSSHILAEISAICDHILIINKGKLIVNDTKENMHLYMKNANEIKLDIKGEEEAIRHALEPIKEIQKCTVEKEEEYSKVILRCSEKEDIRERVFYALADAKCPIIGMETMHNSLEDIFLELTEQSKEEVVEDASDL
ncbi:ABC-type multidrug transport system, ATPase component [Lachnospiraceae bacterium KM106-2]|nr:ABC-type multidrug transport system, ATPase component [Lachnospiraceae bacterium KM106-2]